MVSGAGHTHGSTLELHYTAIGPITIITALKPQQFVSGMIQCNKRAFGPAEQRQLAFYFIHPPPLSSNPTFHLVCALSCKTLPSLVTLIIKERKGAYSAADCPGFLLQQRHS